MKFPVCVACGSTKDLQHHHLVMRSEGGTGDPSNLITLCNACHHKVHSRQMNGTYNAGELIRAGVQEAKARGVKFGRKPKLSEHQRAEAIKRRNAGERLADIAKSYAVDISMISRLEA